MHQTDIIDQLKLHKAGNREANIDPILVQLGALQYVFVLKITWLF